MKRKQFIDIMVQFLLIPLHWALAVYKIIQTIPIVIIGRCNEEIDKYE